jgi:hypothetical protein
MDEHDLGSMTIQERFPSGETSKIVAANALYHTCCKSVTALILMSACDAWGGCSHADRGLWGYLVKNGSLISQICFAIFESCHYLIGDVIESMVTWSMSMAVGPPRTLRGTLFDRRGLHLTLNESNCAKAGHDSSYSIIL